jgi:hypothetical protein
MERANAKGAFEDFRTNEVLTPFVGLRLRHIAYPTEVELPRLPAQVILRGQVLMYWRTEHGDA